VGESAVARALVESLAAGLAMAAVVRFVPVGVLSDGSAPRAVRALALGALGAAGFGAYLAVLLGMRTLVRPPRRSVA
jgi:uncharacterized protein (DUF1810 family)